MLLWLVNLGFAAGAVEAPEVTDFRKLITLDTLVRVVDVKG